MAQILETCISTLHKHVFICLDIVYILKNVGLHGFFPSARQTSIRPYHEGWAPLMEVPVRLLPSDPVLAKSPPSNRLLFGCRLKSVDSSQVAIPAVRLTFNCSTRSCATSSDEEGGAWNADGGIDESKALQFPIGKCAPPLLLRVLILGVQKSSKSETTKCPVPRVI